MTACDFFKVFCYKLIFQKFFETTIFKIFLDTIWNFSMCEGECGLWGVISNLFWLPEFAGILRMSEFSKNGGFKLVKFSFSLISRKLFRLFSSELLPWVKGHIFCVPIVSVYSKRIHSIQNGANFFGKILLATIFLIR